MEQKTKYYLQDIDTTTPELQKLIKSVVGGVLYGYDRANKKWVEDNTGYLAGIYVNKIEVTCITESEADELIKKWGQDEGNNKSI
jgi:two-component SAPR family response regulator